MVSNGTYHGTQTGHMVISELEDVCYAVGNNLEDQIAPTYSEFG